MSRNDSLCSKTRLPKDSCAHCQSESGFTIKETEAYIEILFKGAEFDDRGSFLLTLTQTKAVLASQKIISELALTPKGFEPDIIGQHIPFEHGEIRIDYFPTMPVFGRHQNSPWVRLSNAEMQDLNIGTNRARALHLLTKQLQDWVNRKVSIVPADNTPSDIPRDAGE